MPAPDPRAWNDPAGSPEGRAQALLAAMTVEEKLAQLGSAWAIGLSAGPDFRPDLARARIPHGIGRVTRVSTILPPFAAAGLSNAIQRFLVEETRLGVPAVCDESGCAGALVAGGTCFPAPLGVAASFDPDLAREIGAVTARQIRAVGAHSCLDPVADVARDARWGRCEETYGEDPFLVSEMACAMVEGLQGRDLREGVIACGKHFLGYAASESGHNWAPARMGERELLDVHLPPFAALVARAGLASVMSAYHERDGVPATADRALLTKLLRDRLGFEGTVVSDYFAVSTLATYHNITSDVAEAARLALEAGVDVELPGTEGYATLAPAVEAGAIDGALIDRSALRVLREKFRLGLFERPFADAAAVPAAFGRPQDRALARRAALRSVVMLQNRDGALPLQPDVRRISVIGPAADSPRLQQSIYHFPSQLEIFFGDVPERRGSAAAAAPPPGAFVRSPDAGGAVPAPKDVELDAIPRIALETLLPPTTTILDGVRARAPQGCEVVYAPGCTVTGARGSDFDAALEAVRGADVAVVCLAERSGMSLSSTTGEGNDRADLRLLGVQEALLAEVAATGVPVVAVVLSGRPLVLDRVCRDAGAVLLGWVPGEEGGAALAEVLFGAEPPGGRLPMSLPRGVGQCPVSYAAKPSGQRSQFHGDYVDLPSSPLFPFGHGLSWGEAAYESLALEADTIPTDGRLEARVQVSNPCAAAIEEVVQLYVRDHAGSVTRPMRELKAFARLRLEPGARAEIAFEVDATAFAFHGADMRFAIEPGAMTVQAGRSSADLPLAADFTLTGAVREIGLGAVEPPEVRIRILEAAEAPRHRGVPA